MIISPDTEVRMLAEVTTGAGTSRKDGIIQTDSLIATVWVNSITSGTLTVELYTTTNPGKDLLLFTFPPLSGPSTTLLLRKAGISMSNFYIKATYTGVCDYEAHVRAVTGAGESSVKIVGSATLSTSHITIPTSPTVLIPFSLTDRNGLIIKNWNTSGNLYIADNSGEANPTDGYPIAPGEALSIDITAGVVIYAAASTGTIDVRILEAGG